MAEQKTRELSEQEHKVLEYVGNTQISSRRMMERVWFRNILYYIGEQYLEWVVSLNSFRRKNSVKLKPTPVDNIIREYVRSMKALFLSRRAIPRIYPNSNDLQDIEAAKLGQSVITYLDDQNDGEFNEEKELLLIWLIIIGTTFMRTYFSSDYGMYLPGTDIKTGDVACRALSPFNVIPDRFGERLRYMRYIGLRYMVPREWAEDTYKVKLEPQEGKDLDMAMFQQRLMEAVASVSKWKGAGLSSGTTTEPLEDMVVIREVEFAPTKNFKKGRHIAQVGTTVLFARDELPIPVTKDGKWDYSITDFHYNHVPGRFWSDSGIVDLISQQDSVNEIDQALNVNRKSLGRPWVSAPKGAGFRRVNTGDEHLLVIEYDPMMGAPRPPEFHPGVPYPAQVLQERQTLKETIQDQSGDPKHILRGQSPSAQASGVMVNLLKETAESGHVPDIDGFYRKLGSVHRKRLVLVSKYYTEKRYIKIAGKGKQVRVKAFTGSDLRDNTDLRLELDAGSPSTATAKTQMIMQLAQTPLMEPIIQNPAARQDIFRRLGLGGIPELEDPDVTYAEMENAKIAMDDFQGIMLLEGDPEGGEPTVVMDDPTFKFHRHDIHLPVHRKFLMSDEFRDMSEKAKVVLMTHLEAHILMVAIAEKQAADAAAAAAQVGGAPGATAGPTAGATRPGGSPAPGSPNEQAQAGQSTGTPPPTEA